MVKTYQTSEFGDPPPTDHERRDPYTGVLLSPEAPSRGMEVESRRIIQTPIERSPSGGLNSKIAGRWDLIDTDALLRLAAVLQYGTTKYSEDNWRLDPVELHLSHTLEHIFQYFKTKRERGIDRVPYLEDGSIDELGHAFCRLMFALAVENQPEGYYRLVQKNNGVES